MKIVHDIRERQAWEAPKRSGPLPIVLGALIAFGIGLLGVSGLIRTPNVLSKPKTMAVAVNAVPEDKTAPVVIDSANRIGRAVAAPLLKLCIPMQKLGIEAAMEPGDLYRMLQSASSMSRVAALAGIRQQAIDEVQFAALWAEVADCVYRQNGWMLCDPDNRAFAVEAVNTFVRQLSAAARADKTPDSVDKTRAGLRLSSNRDYLLQQAQATRTRVMASLRHHAAEGRLIASDFGLFAFSEVMQVMRDTRATRNGCASRG